MCFAENPSIWILLTFFFLMVRLVLWVRGTNAPEIKRPGHIISGVVAVSLIAHQ